MSRIRAIQARFVSVQTRTQGGRPAASAATNIRPVETQAAGQQDPNFGKLLQAQMARYATQSLSSTGTDGRRQESRDGGLGALFGLVPGAGALGSTVEQLAGSYGLLPSGSTGAGSGLSRTRQLAGATGVSVHKYNPFRNLEMTSGFGVREFMGRAEEHNGTDYAVREGTPLPAIGPGRIVSTSKDAVFGRNVVYQLDSGETIRYAHVTEKVPFPLRAGQRVQAGDIVAISGNTGESTGPHVHVSIQMAGQYIDPHQYLSLLP